MLCCNAAERNADGPWESVYGSSIESKDDNRTPVRHIDLVVRESKREPVGAVERRSTVGADIFHDLKPAPGRLFERKEGCK